jgi:hypothetical protein
VERSLLLAATLFTRLLPAAAWFQPTLFSIWWWLVVVVVENLVVVAVLVDFVQALRYRFSPEQITP